MLDAEEAEHSGAENSNHIIGLTAIARMLRYGVSAVPAAPVICSGGVVCARLDAFVLALQQVQGARSLEGILGGNVVALVSRSTLVAKIVLLILLVFSIVSWSIILYKLWSFRRIGRQTARFLDVFRRSTKFSEVQAVCQSLADSPLVGIFQAGYAELNAQLRQGGASAEAGASPGPRRRRPTLEEPGRRSTARCCARRRSRSTSSRRRVTVPGHDGQHHAVHRPVRDGVGHHERRSRASAQAGSTNLGVVAPGIAEALIATAAGLFAAIPAVYFYNHLTTNA